VAENLRLAEDVAPEIARVARARNAGSIVIDHSSHGCLHEFLRGSGFAASRAWPSTWKSTSLPTRVHALR
jgi:hypothetical protein